MRRLILCGSLLLACGAAHAESNPAAGRYDARMKHVVYNRADVVKVVGHYGYSTDIEFADDESVQNIALGDSLAWEVAPAGNHLFVKPREDNAVTNMTVITNKRVYQLSLDARGSRGVSGPKSSAMFFQVRFSYPEEVAAKAKAELDARIAKSHAIRMQSALNKPPEPKNWNYYACGTKQVQPTEVFDDGRFTYMRFPGAQEIPAVFILNADGTESIVNGGMRGEQYVAQTTARRFILRRGKAVACVENRSFNPYGVTTPTQTVTPDVKRSLNDAAAATGTALPATLPEAPVVVPTATSNGAGATSQPLPTRYLPDGQPAREAGLSDKPLEGIGQ